MVLNLIAHKSAYIANGLAIRYSWCVAMIPKLPPLPIPLAEASEMPDQCIFPSEDGFYYATANFKATIPLWRRYKRIGWAKRYINKARPTMREADLCQTCGAILVENVHQCLRCGTSR